jgi:hypothetical protein
MTAAVSFRREMMEASSARSSRAAGTLSSHRRRCRTTPRASRACPASELSASGSAAPWRDGTSRSMSVLDEAAADGRPRKTVDDQARSGRSASHIAADRLVWPLHLADSGNRRPRSSGAASPLTAARLLAPQPIDVPGLIRSASSCLPRAKCCCRSSMPQAQGESWTGTGIPVQCSVRPMAADMDRVGPDRSARSHEHQSRSAATGLALFRSRWADFIHRSRSEDNGATWSAAAPTDLPTTPSSRHPLADGRLAPAYNHQRRHLRGRHFALRRDRRRRYAGRRDDRPASLLGAAAGAVSLVFSRTGETVRPPRSETGGGYCLSNSSVDSINREFSYPTVRSARRAGRHRLHLFPAGIKHVRLSI